MSIIKKPLREQEISDIASNPTKLRQYIDAFKFFEKEYRDLKSNYERNMSELFNSIVGLVGISSITSLISFGFWSGPFIRNYLIWSAPYLILALVTTILAFTKRKFINITAWPLLVGYHEDVLIGLNGSIEELSKIITKLYKRFNYLLKLHDIIVVLLTIFFFSFFIQLYTYIFEQCINFTSNILITALLLILGFLIYYILRSRLKSSGKRIKTSDSK